MTQPTEPGDAPLTLNLADLEPGVERSAPGSLRRLVQGCTPDRLPASPMPNVRRRDVIVPAWSPDRRIVKQGSVRASMDETAEVRGFPKKRLSSMSIGPWVRSDSPCLVVMITQAICHSVGELAMPDQRILLPDRHDHHRA